MRKFIIKMLVIAFPVVVIAILYIYFIKNVYPNLSGDLGFLGKIPFGTTYDKTHREPLISKMYFDQYPEGTTSDSIHMFIVGDSFSQQGPLSYQNFYAKKSGKVVINIPENVLESSLMNYSPEQRAVLLLNAGFFDIYPTNYVVIQTGERYLRKRILQLNLKESYSENIKSKNRDNFVTTPASSEKKFFADWLKFSLYMEPNPIKQVNLSRNLFSHKDGAKLYFYYQDLDNLDIADQDFDVISQKIIQMRRLFQNKGIDLIYIIVPDKYEVYQDYIINNPYPYKKVGTQIDSRLKKDWILFPLSELKAPISKGEKDVYLLNDSHWSQKGAQIAGELLFETIQKREIKN